MFKPKTFPIISFPFNVWKLSISILLKTYIWMRINSYRREMEDKVWGVFQGRIQNSRKIGQLKEKKKKSINWQDQPTKGVSFIFHIEILFCTVSETHQLMAKTLLCKSFTELKVYFALNIKLGFYKEKNNNNNTLLTITLATFA